MVSPTHTLVQDFDVLLINGPTSRLALVRQVEMRSLTKSTLPHVIAKSLSSSPVMRWLQSDRAGGSSCQIFRGGST